MVGVDLTAQESPCLYSTAGGEACHAGQSGGHNPDVVTAFTILYYETLEHVLRCAQEVMSAIAMSTGQDNGTIPRKG